MKTYSVIPPWGRPPLLLLLILTSGCESHLMAGRFNHTVPILVGPVMRIGGASRKPPAMKHVLAFEGEKQDVASAAGGTHYENIGGQVYQVSQYASAKEVSGNLSYTIKNASRAARRRLGGILHIQRICARAWFHHYLVYASDGLKISLEGEALLPDGFAP